MEQNINEKIYQLQKEITWLELWKELQENRLKNIEDESDKETIEVFKKYFLVLYDVIRTNEPPIKNDFKEVSLTKTDNGWTFKAIASGLVMEIDYYWVIEDRFYLIISLGRRDKEKIFNSNIITPFATNDVYFEELRKIIE